MLTINKFKIIDIPGGEYRFRIDDGELESTDEKPLTISRNGITYPIADTSKLLVRDTTEVYSFDEINQTWDKLGG